MFLLHVGQRIQEVCERQQQQLVASGTLGQTAGGHAASPEACEPQIAKSVDGGL